MKKILCLLLTLTMVFSLCACGGETSVVGKYKNVGPFLRYECTLNENTTYDIAADFYNGSKKGTYTVDGKAELTIKPTDSPADIWRKHGDYYYVTDSNYLTNVFKEDEEYKLKPTFDENGRSNQSFETGYRDPDNYYETYKISFKDDGTYSLERKAIDCWSLETEVEEKIEGTYKVENDILKLTHESNEYIMLLIDDMLFFDVLEKVE